MFTQTHVFTQCRAHRLELFRAGLLSMRSQSAEFLHQAQHRVLAFRKAVQQFGESVIASAQSDGENVALCFEVGRQRFVDERDQIPHGRTLRITRAPANPSGAPVDLTGAKKHSLMAAGQGA